MYLRREAVLSSQIEGTQSSLSDLLLFELEEVPGIPTSPLRQVGTVAKSARLAEPTVATVFKKMTKLGLVREVTGKRRNWIFGYDPYLPILSEGTEVE